MLSYVKFFNYIKLNLKLKKQIIFFENSTKLYKLIDLLIAKNVIHGYKLTENKKQLILFLNMSYDYNLMKNFFYVKNVRTIKKKNLITMQNKYSSSNYIYSTSKGLLDSKTVLFEKLGGILLFKV